MNSFNNLPSLSDPDTSHQQYHFWMTIIFKDENEILLLKDQLMKNKWNQKLYIGLSALEIGEKENTPQYQHYHCHLYLKFKRKKSINSIINQLDLTNYQYWIEKNSPFKLAKRRINYMKKTQSKVNGNQLLFEWNKS